MVVLWAIKGGSLLYAREILSGLLQSFTWTVWILEYLLCTLAFQF